MVNSKESTLWVVCSWLGYYEIALLGSQNYTKVPGIPTGWVLCPPLILRSALAGNMEVGFGPELQKSQQCPQSGLEEANLWVAPSCGKEAGPCH